MLWPALIVLMAVAMFFQGKTGDDAKRHFEDAIRREVPAAATQAQVEVWLDRYGIDHTYFEDTAGDLRGQKTMAEIAGLRNQDLSGMVRGQIQCPDEKAKISQAGRLTIYFFFDKQQTCVGHLVDWFAYSL